MLEIAPPWEQGSDFHLAEFADPGTPELPPGVDFYGSGRDAIRALLTYGVEGLGWQELWIPSYFCQTVVRDMRMPGLEIRSYGDNPLDDVEAPIVIESARRGAVLTLNPFGLRAKNRPLVCDRERLELIEDHTHDPWSSLVTGSEADYAVVSLRKTVPIPDGGLLWSPQGKQLPPTPPVSPTRSAASLRKLAGMTLKRLYLQGGEPDKSQLRSYLVSGESEIAAGAASSMPLHTRSLLQSFPARTWRDTRRRNFERIAAQLQGIPGLQVLRPQGASAVPFMAILLLETGELRERLRQALIESSIYPAQWSNSSQNRSAGGSPQNRAPPYP